jgi:Flp pilus assembly protein TadG
MFRLTHRSAAANKTSPSSEARSPRGEGRSASRWRNFFAKLDDSGATGVEFTIVAPPLFLLLLTIVDLGMMLTTQSLLDGAARDAARLIRTGQAQNASTPRTTFQNLLCSDMTPIMSTSTCQSALIYEVQVFNDFASVSFGPCTQDTDSTQPGYCAFNGGAASQIIGVQVTYNRPFLVPWVGACLGGGSCWFGAGSSNGSNAGSSTVPLVSTVIFRNEPFPSS